VRGAAASPPCEDTGPAPAGAVSGVRIDIVDQPEAGRATGTVVVIDVLRAFTTAAYAFAAGVREIRPVSTIDEAVADRGPGVLLLGEEDGLPVRDFDLDNSPEAMADRRLPGAVVVQRTTAGTQGLVAARRAQRLFAASFVCAAATASAVAAAVPAGAVTLVVTGSHSADRGDEDRACAEYLAGLLDGARPAPGPYLDRVLASAAAQKFLDPEQPDFPAADPGRCAELDRFGFSMPVTATGGRLVMRAQQKAPAG
jgi:2-phosphosulfolactate phosphatase